MVDMSLLDSFFLISAYIGVALWFYRGWPRPEKKVGKLKSYPLVSIIVPARNEEKNLKVLLPSLCALNYPHKEIIVVDDESTDETSAVSASFGVKVRRAEPRPEGWAGKPWACHQGAQIAQGDFLLFTDADTMHLPNSLEEAITFIEGTEADLVSALPYHASQGWWAQFMGPFHAVLLSLTGPFQKPKLGRLFAIGQYLLFRSSYYQGSGGHVAVRDEFAEDLALAKHCISSGGRYELHWGKVWYWVDMYDSLNDFYKGWRRNFRQGMKHSRPLVFLETILLISAIVGGGQWFNTSLAFIPTVLSLWVIYRLQFYLGRFSLLGPACFPFSLFFFVYISLSSAYDRFFKRDVLWKKRAYYADPTFKPEDPAS